MAKSITEKNSPTFIDDLCPKYISSRSIFYLPLTREENSFSNSQRAILYFGP